MKKIRNRKALTFNEFYAWQKKHLQIESTKIYAPFLHADTSDLEVIIDFSLHAEIMEYKHLPIFPPNQELPTSNLNNN